MTAALEVVTAAAVDAAAELDGDRWRRIRAATCATSPLPDVELDRHALRVFYATTKGPTDALATLEGERETRRPSPTGGKAR